MYGVLYFHLLLLLYDAYGVYNIVIYYPLILISLYLILYLAWHRFCSLMLISLSGHMVTWSHGGPLFYIFPFEPTPNPFLLRLSDIPSLRILSRFLTPPLSLFRLSVLMPFAGIGPPAYFSWCSTVRDGDPTPPQEVLPLS